MSTVKTLLEASQISTQWYSVIADMPNPPAALVNPGRTAGGAGRVRRDFSRRAQPAGNGPATVNSDTGGRCGGFTVAGAAPPSTVRGARRRGDRYARKVLLQIGLPTRGRRGA